MANTDPAAAADTLARELEALLVEYNFGAAPATELSRFLVILVLDESADDGTHAFSPSPAIDWYWHNAILETHLYKRLRRALARALQRDEVHLRHYHMRAEDSPATKEVRYQRTLAAYARLYSTAPLRQLWPPSHPEYVDSGRGGQDAGPGAGQASA